MPDAESSESPTFEEFVAAVRSSAVPVALWDLVSMRILALSRRGAELLGLEPHAENFDWLRLLDDPEPARRGLEEIRDGVFDAYQARRRFRIPDGDVREVVTSVRAADESRRLAIAVFVETNGTLEQSFGDIEAVIGTLDEGGRIRQISSDVTGLLGYVPAVCVGMALESLVHPSDVGFLLEALSRTASEDANVAVDVRVRAADDSWRPVHLTLAPASAPTAAFGFAAVPVEPMTVATDGDPSDRVVELEQHLTRIAREVEAAGLVGRRASMPDRGQVPALDDLSSRQWQILIRLLQGDRVPTIARAMYLSPSTIRNHLSTIYKKFGVHSQAELIEKFPRSE
jgi:PAS domain S-box-containing protein